MKKIKLLTPILSVAALGSVIAPIATSCAQTTTETDIPTSLLNIVGYTLKGFKSDADVSNYSTLVIPEGVKYIDNNAFKDAFVTGGKNYNIKTVVMPTTLREIRQNAFDGCSSLRVLDFSKWNHDQIHYLTCEQGDENGAFINMSKLGYVVTNENITDESKDKLQSLLTSANLDTCWFAPIAKDKLTPDETWRVQKKQSGKNAKYLFTLNVDLPDDASLYAQVTRTSGTKGIDVTCTNTKLSAKDNKVYELPVSLMNQTETDEYAEFAVTFTAIKDASGEEFEPLWQQVMTGFKLINIKGEDPEPEPEPSTDVDLFDYTYTPSYEPVTSENNTVTTMAKLLTDKFSEYESSFVGELRYSLSQYLNSLEKTAKALGGKGIIGIDDKERIGKLTISSFSYNSDHNSINFSGYVDMHFIIDNNDSQYNMTFDLKMNFDFVDVDYIMNFDFGSGLVDQFVPKCLYNVSSECSNQIDISIEEGSLNFAGTTVTYNDWWAKLSEGTWTYKAAGSTPTPLEQTAFELARMMVLQPFMTFHTPIYYLTNAEYVSSFIPKANTLNLQLSGAYYVGTMELESKDLKDVEFSNCQASLYFPDCGHAVRSLLTKQDNKIYVVFNLTAELLPTKPKNALISIASYDKNNNPITINKDFAVTVTYTE